MWFLSGSAFSFDFNKLSCETTSGICKFLNNKHLSDFSQTCKLIQRIAKSEHAHDSNTAVKIDDKWHRYFSSIVYEINGVLFPFVIIPGGTCTMGGDKDQQKVTISSPLLVQMTPVTQQQYNVITDLNPSYFTPTEALGNLPFELVSHNDIVGDNGFIKKLESFGLLSFRLPTKEEWEYFARAGTESSYFWGNDEKIAGDYSWCHANSDKKTHPVATKRANGWRIFDTAGNVWEWTNSPHKENNEFVIRGGSWESGPGNLRSFVYISKIPEERSLIIGFRLVKTLNL